MKLLQKFLIQTYNVGIIRKNVRDVLDNGVNSGEISWLKHNYKDRFFADPFMIKEDSQYYYILVEEFIFWEEKGKISLLKVKKDDFTLYEKQIIIEEDTHLSFPFCQKNGNSVIPESVQSGKTIEYFIDLEKMKVINKHIIIDEGLIDAAFFTDMKENKWVFASKVENPKTDLYMYKLDGDIYKPLNNGKVVLSSIQETRSAGRLFFDNGVLYRPVQDSTERYGSRTRIMKINKLDEKNYMAECVKIISSEDNPPYNETLHTFNVYDDCIIVDGSIDILRFPMKLFYKKFKWLFKEKRTTSK